MKAIVQEGYGSPDVLRLREIDMPVVGDDQVLVRIRAASVNASDWYLLSRLPHIIGRALRVPVSRVRGGDLAGQVEAVGKNVTRFKPGDEVFGAGIGTFAEFATTFETRLAPKPRNLTFEQAAAIPGAGCTALQGLRDTAHVRAGERVLVYGAGGGVGMFAVQIAKSLGASVTAVSRTTNTELLRSLGADEVLDYTQEDFTTRGRRYDVLFDIGANRSLADCGRVLAGGGRVVLVGAARGPWAALSRLVVARLVSRPTGRFMSFLAKVRSEDLLALKGLAEAGRLAPVVDRQYSLSETPDAVRYVGTRQARGKVVIRVT